MTGRLTASGAVAAAGDTLLGGSGATVASVDVVVELYNNNHGDRDRGGGMDEYDMAQNLRLDPLLPERRCLVE